MIDHPLCSKTTSARHLSGVSDLSCALQTLPFGARRSLPTLGPLRLANLNTGPVDLGTTTPIFAFAVAVTVAVRGWDW